MPDITIQRCPFFKDFSSQRICCEGPCEGANIHVRFVDSDSRSRFMLEHCCLDHPYCYIYMGLMRKYEDEME